jgi:NTE family protein
MLKRTDVHDLIPKLLEYDYFTRTINPFAYSVFKMLVLQTASQPARHQGRIGIAIAGGGPTGGMYELGALRALEVAIEGLDLNRLDVYVGVSSGAFLAAGLVNKLSITEICQIFITGKHPEIRFKPRMFLKPAFLEYGKRVARLPGLAFDWWKNVLLDPSGSHLNEFMSRFTSAVPTGLFDNAPIETFLKNIFTGPGRSNDFRNLDRPLFVVAVDLDQGKAVRFGSKGWDDIPISQAVQASAALPGLYPPVDIHGHHFVDGALRRTMHASVILDHGIDLMIGLNPFVPFNAKSKHHAKSGTKLADGGLPLVLSQTFRTLLQSRMQVGLAKYAQQYPETDQLVLEPNEDDAEMFFTSVFSYSTRHKVCEHAFQSTLRDLKNRAEALTPLLAKHGLRLKHEILNNAEISLLDGMDPTLRRTATTAQLWHNLNDLEHQIKKRNV